MKREEAELLLKSYIKNPRMIAHCFASELVMRALALHFGEDENQWGLAGLLHDIDVEVTNADPLVHGPAAAEILRPLGIDETIIEAIALHNEMATDTPRSTRFHHALAAGETITGLIFATTMVYPDRNIGSVKTKSIVKRMKEKAFAASVKRENILECELIGLSIDEFATLCLNALAPHSKLLMD